MFELGGPTALSMRAIIARALRSADLRRPIFPGPAALIKLGLQPMRLVPEPLLTPDAIDFINQPATVDLAPLLARMPRRLTTIRRRIGDVPTPGRRPRDPRVRPRHRPVASVGPTGRGGDGGRPMIAYLPQPRSSRLANVAIGAIPLAVGVCSSLLTQEGLRVWYRTIERPSWNPPDWVFGPVWTTLYVMMGIALVQVVGAESDRVARQVGLGLFVVQLILNFGWSWVFFVNHDLFGALVEIIALWLAIAATAVTFAATRRSAGLLLVPYLAWVSFATVLTAAIWRLNR